MCPPSLVGVGGEVSGVWVRCCRVGGAVPLPSSSGRRSSGRGGSGRRAVRVVSRSGWVELPGEGVTLTDAEVVDGPDVEAAQLEHEVHLGGPAADAAYGDQLGGRF